MILLVIRKFGSLLRGKATPFQIYSACLIGSIVGFLPNKSQCLGLYLLFFGIVLILNANLFITAFSIPILKLLSYLLVPASVSIGHALLNGFVGDLLKPLINMPFIAWFGLEYYVTIGCLLFGVLFGIIIGSTLVFMVTKFRKTMVVLENDSEKYQKWMQKKWVKIMVWLFLGKDKGKKLTYEDLLKKKVGNPIRILGLIIVISASILGWFLSSYYTNDIIRWQMADTLGSLNGATVDIENVDASISGGKLKISNIAFADPKDLMRNRFELHELTMDLDVSSILKKKFHIEQLLLGKISSNTQRKIKAELIVSPPPPPEDPANPGLLTKISDKALEQIPLKDSYEDFDDLMETFNAIKEKANEIYNHEITQKIIAAARAPKEIKDPTLTEAIIDNYNNTMSKNLMANHLLEKSPFFLIKEIKCDQAFYSSEKWRDATLRITDISSNPAYVAEAPKIEINNPIRKYRGVISLNNFQDIGKSNECVVTVNDIDGAALGKKITIQGKKPLKKGTIQLQMKCNFTNLKSFTIIGTAELQKVVLEVPEINEITIDKLSLLFELCPFDSPIKFRVDTDDLQDQLKKEVKNQLKKKGKEALNNIKDDILGDHKLDANLLQDKKAQQDIIKNIKDEPDKLKDLNNLFKSRDDKKDDKKDDRKDNKKDDKKDDKKKPEKTEKPK